MKDIMTNFIQNLLNLCIVPFKDNNIFIGVAGILAVSWCFRAVHKLINGNY